MGSKLTNIDRAALVDGVLAGATQRKLASTLKLSRPTIIKLCKDPTFKSVLEAERKRRSLTAEAQADARIATVMRAAVKVACGEMTLDPVQERYSRRILGWDEQDNARQLTHANGDGLISPRTPVIVQVINQTQAKIEETQLE